MIQKGDHFITLTDFSKQELLNLLIHIKKFDSNLKSFTPSKNKSLICNLFYEPSTRTSSSFFAAAKFLGHDMITINNVQFSSVSKGESLEDTIRTLASYTHCIILRHPEEGSSAIAANISDVPIINAGDGVGEHPTQTLLDLYTIYKHYGKLDNLTVTLMGDLKYGRTVHSLASALMMFDTKVYLVSPKELRIPESYLGPNFEQRHTLDNTILGTSDVLYMTRVQSERGGVGQYEFDRWDFNHLSKTCIVMHPLPRVNELPTWFDDDPRAKYFEQMDNGLAVRKYLLRQILG